MTDLGSGLDLDLELTETGDPARPVVTVPLDDWAGAPAERIDAAARAVASALPLTLGVLHGPPPARLRPLLDTLTLTLAPGVPGVPATASVAGRTIVTVTDVDSSVKNLLASVTSTPRAAVACGLLLRQAERLDGAGGLAAEAAVFSMLLAGPEFARWLAARGGPRPVPRPGRPLVRLHRDGGRLDIVLDHPERRNSLSFVLREELLAALQVAEADPTVTDVQVSGAGPGFCSGGDLDEFGTATDVGAAYLVRLARAPWRVVDQLADRVTMRVHGACVGAGAELAAFAGTVVAAPDTFFALPEVGMGLVPGAGGTVSVPRRIGRWRAAWLMLTGTRLDAATALEWGLVDAITPPM